MKEIIDFLINNLSEKRYKHVLGVAETAKKLAKLNGADESKAELAAMLHDIAKEMPIDEQMKILKKNNFNITEIEKASPQVLHGFVGEFLAREKFNIDDEEVLKAVAYHTTGKANMAKLEKIIYIADYIEPTRNYPGVEILRETTYKDLDEGVLMGINNTIKLLVDKNGVIHPLTIEARNYLLIKESKVTYYL
ncbi:bis(5'-nucleosyl)-tetraphosphatase (symmetrical) YqeK [Clostridium massiliamazoniense]|uniref:bis(5'-nucleosyl)-tetraphosphatase (symmetrical) YqeK n=1 Tax=Clostridium massiliamazoniense TaxID=1347366 RepID=UPI0006D7E51A|nr:bis(5'-nucleosyl)-tetraphosphatase (symmetrical) YqeK [Clostridium massiliamazoniense]